MNHSFEITMTNQETRLRVNAYDVVTPWKLKKKHFCWNNLLEKGQQLIVLLYSFSSLSSSPFGRHTGDMMLLKITSRSRRKSKRSKATGWASSDVPALRSFQPGWKVASLTPYFVPPLVLMCLPRYTLTNFILWSTGKQWPAVRTEHCVTNLFSFKNWIKIFHTG